MSQERRSIYLSTLSNILHMEKLASQEAERDQKILNHAVPISAGLLGGAGSLSLLGKAQEAAMNSKNEYLKKLKALKTKVSRAKAGTQAHLDAVDEQTVARNRMLRRETLENFLKSKYTKGGTAILAGGGIGYGAHRAYQHYLNRNNVE